MLSLLELDYNHLLVALFLQSDALSVSSQKQVGFVFAWVRVAYAIAVSRVFLDGVFHVRSCLTQSQVSPLFLVCAHSLCAREKFWLALRCSLLV